MSSYILIVFSCIFVGSIGKIVYPCITPDNEIAYCMSLFSCPHMMKLLGSLEPSSLNFVKKSICLGCEAGDFMVCCGSPKNHTNVQRFPSQTAKPVITTIGATVTPNNSISVAKESPNRKLLPTLVYCGLQHTDDRVYSDNETALDEQPWLVHVLLTDLEFDTEYTDRCSGVLISNRYVLTNYFCGDEGLAIRLGEYNTNQNVSCFDNPDFPECTEQTIDIYIEERIHKSKKNNGYYEFTLLRLAKTVAYSDFIRPICLPMDETNRPTNFDFVIVSGWGAPSKKGVNKKRIIYDVVDEEVCFKERSDLKRPIKDTNVNFICAFPQKNNTDVACYGDRGGPFVYSQKHQWFLEGIIVNTTPDDSTICSKNTSVSGIRITPETIEWIIHTIRK